MVPRPRKIKARVVSRPMVTGERYAAIVVFVPARPRKVPKRLKA